METTVGNVTVGRESELWVNEDLSITVHEILSDCVGLMFNFQTKNQTDVVEVRISVSSGYLGEEVTSSARGIFGRSLRLNVGGWVNIPDLGITVKALEWETARQWVTFDITADEVGENN